MNPSFTGHWNLPLALARHRRGFALCRASLNGSFKRCCFTMIGFAVLCSSSCLFLSATQERRAGTGRFSANRCRVVLRYPDLTSSALVMSLRCLLSLPVVTGTSKVCPAVNSSLVISLKCCSLMMLIPFLSAILSSVSPAKISASVAVSTRRSAEDGLSTFRVIIFLPTGSHSVFPFRLFSARSSCFDILCALETLLRFSPSATTCTLSFVLRTTLFLRTSGWLVSMGDFLS
mmetsp:Transcript_21288/g.35672  ORF Transcript_21288/g.35672 Transcript_21288/m.35672 type:complete len:232 (+) Transcript_21288:521-1216(+)